MEGPVGGRGGPVFGDPTRPGGKLPPWVKGDPRILGGQGQPQIEDILRLEGKDGGGGGGQSTTGGMPIPKPDVSIAQPQGGGGWQRQDNQGQQFLDNLRRQFETMSPEQRMQNAGNFQRDMDRWQSNFGEGGNTREQVDLFNQIKDGIGSQRLRGFADPNNPMQFNDRQLREQSDARVQQRQGAEGGGYAPAVTNPSDRNAQWMAQFRKNMHGDFADRFKGPDGVSQAQEFNEFGRSKFGSDQYGAGHWASHPAIRKSAWEQWNRNKLGLGQPQQSSLQNLSNQAQGRREGAFSPSQYNPSVASQSQGAGTLAQETPLWKQKMTPDMTTRQKNQIANARYRHYKPTMPVGRDGLNKVEANARLREQNAARRKQASNPTTVNVRNPNQGLQQSTASRFRKPNLKNVSSMANPRMSLQQMYRN